MRDDDLHIVEDDTNGKEDSQTPTDKGSIMDEDECLPSTNTKLAHEVSSLQKQCAVLSHQMNMLMGRLGMPPCPCATCREVLRQQHQQQQHRLPVNGAPAAAPAVPAATEAAPAVPAPMAHPMMAGTPMAIPIANGIRIINSSAMQRAPVPQPVTLPVVPKVETTTTTTTTAMEATPSENGSTSTEGESKEVSVIKSPQTDAATNQLLTSLFNVPGVLQSISNVSPAGAAPNPFAEQNHGGRKSKYCTPDLKRAVAEYASFHGAAQAARKFGIPPSVAAYYQRKLAKIKQNERQAAQIVVAQSLGVSPLHIKPESMPSTADSHESPMKNSLDCTPGTPTTPSYLRGRGRGRPKLIGDELDAELIEYMVKLKKDNPTLHLNPQAALDIARAYIIQNSPGLLEEQGGSVKLKLTWAMKLVSRIAEREQEIKLGLPAGSLNNYGRSGLQQLQSLSESNMLNDLTQNLFLQQLAAQMQGEQIMTPEITNVKELSLADFTFGDITMGDDVNEEEKDGSTTPEVNEEAAEQAMEAALQSCQPSLTAC